VVSDRELADIYAFLLAIPPPPSVSSIRAEESLTGRSRPAAAGH
jgi:hypothetical protein